MLLSGAAARRKVATSAARSRGLGSTLTMVSSPPSRLDGDAGRLASSGNLGLRLLPPPALELGRRPVVGCTMETLVVPPVDPFAGRKLDMLGRSPGPATVDQLRLVEPMDRLRDGIVEAVPLGAHRTDGACLRQPVRVANGQVLHAPVGMVDEALELLLASVPECHLQRVQGQLRVQRAGDPPAHDVAAEDVDNEGHVDEPGACPNVGQVSHPEPVGSRRRELAVDQIGRPLGQLVGDRGPLRLAPDHAFQAHLAHQARHPFPTDRDVLPVQLPPDLLDPVDLEVLLAHTLDLDLELGVTQPAGRGRPRTCLIVGGGGDLQDLADRLDSELPPVLVDVAVHLARRPSSSAAKKADALFRISFARRSSRFSFSSSVIRRRSSEVTPGRLPSSISACLTQLRSDSGPIPSCRATRVTTPKRSPLSAMAPRTIRTALSRSSGGYRRWLGLFDVDMESSYSQ